MRVRWDIDERLATEWYGTYRVFLRGKRTAGSAGDIPVKLVVKLGNSYTIFESSELTFSTTRVFQVLDFGLVTIPSDAMRSSETPTNLYIEVHMESTVVGPPDVYLYDLIMMPVDECIVEINDAVRASSAATAVRPDIAWYVDSITYPKRMIRALRYRTTTGTYSGTVGDISGVFQCIAGQPVQFRPNATQRIWFFALNDNTNERWNPHLVHSATVARLARYQGLRGGR